MMKASDIDRVQGLLREYDTAKEVLRKLESRENILVFVGTFPEQVTVELSPVMLDTFRIALRAKALQDISSIGIALNRLGVTLDNS